MTNAERVSNYFLNRKLILLYVFFLSFYDLSSYDLFPYMCMKNNILKRVRDLHRNAHLSAKSVYLLIVNVFMKFLWKIYFLMKYQ